MTQPPMADGIPGRQSLTDVQVMHSRGAVVVQIEAPVLTAIVLTADEADELADSLRQQARHARDLVHVCDCGHEGLDAMFHLTPCPVALLRRQARKLGYDLALVPREDTDA